MHALHALHVHRVVGAILSCVGAMSGFGGFGGVALDEVGRVLGPGGTEYNSEVTCEHFWDGAVFVVRIRGERRRWPLMEVLGSVALMALAQMVRLHPLLRAGAVCVGGSYALFKVCEVQFGWSEMRVGEDSVTFTTRVLGLGRSRTFAKADVERLAWVRGSKDEPPVFGVMLRPLLLPIGFGWGISQDEASAVLMAIAESGSWIAQRTLRVGTPLF